MRTWQFVLSMVGAAFLGAIIVILSNFVITGMQSMAKPAATSAQNRLKAAYAKCSKEDDGSYMTQGEDSSIRFSEAKDGEGAALSCLLSELKMPDATISKMQNTSGLDGTQSDSWDGIKATWSYNANREFDAFQMVLEAAE
ncbi:hypothetical protein COO72_11485 [Bifidobacterium callitrichos]|nr:hypothetical protein COO72_11485 [Bifidobacterium callitrichos]